MKRTLLALGTLLAAMLACGTDTTQTTLTVTAFIDEDGSGSLTEPHQPLPDTLVIATWNQHGNMLRDIQRTDSNGQAVFSVTYTHFFDVSLMPACGYQSTTPLYRDVKGVETAGFGFQPAGAAGGEASRVKVLIWRDLNSNGGPDPQEGLPDQQASIMFNIPGGGSGNIYDQDTFLQKSEGGWFDLGLGNSCGTLNVLLLDGEQETLSVSEPGGISDAGSHGNTYYPAIQIPYGSGETVVYWEIK